ncbi:MAG: preprotein translocase subunit SecE [Clostridiales bacterium]|jgi:preprotein translocase subunit SecE|nr:preprotein translocase subunit SecE [Clostridiales bacterium]
MSKDNVNEKKDSKKASAKSSKTKRNSFGMKVAKYFKDLKSEFSKVVWPSKKQVFNNTLVVLSFTGVIMLFIFGLDTGLTALLRLILKQG